ncbi:MAG: SH3 domain-containing protein [Candidatus Coatesbacteria bacterium]|nr:MAG: SH3 domain-containing protein [Candidatus Coatesbacteria bacterium]
MVLLATPLILIIGDVNECAASDFDVICIVDGAKAYKDEAMSEPVAELAYWTVVSWVDWREYGYQSVRLADGSIVFSDSQNFGRALTTYVDALNVRSQPNLSGGVTARIERDEEFAEAPTGWEFADGYGWLKVKLPDGSEGWAASIYLIPRSYYRELEKAEALAKSGDTDALIKELESLTGIVEGFPDEKGTVGVSPDGKYVVFSMVGGILVVFEQGAGITAYHDIFLAASAVKWSQNSRYYAFDEGSWILRGLHVFDTEDGKTALDAGVLQDNYYFIGEDLFVWVEYDQLSSETKFENPDAEGIFEDENKYLEVPSVRVLDLRTGETITVLEPNPNTLRKDGYPIMINLAPTDELEGNADRLKPITDLDLFKEYAEKPQICIESQA